MKCPDRRCWQGTIYAHDLYEGPCRPEDKPINSWDPWGYRKVACPTCGGRGEIPDTPLEALAEAAG